MAARGESVHGEADLVTSLVPSGAAVLDAGCGTGRVAIELASRGYEVVGVDLDPAMLDLARAKAPELGWLQGDLASTVVIDSEAERIGSDERVHIDNDSEAVARAARERGEQEREKSGVTAQAVTNPRRLLGERPRRFDAVVAAGNVMIFLERGTEAAVVANLAAHLRPSGVLVAGFQLSDAYLQLHVYDALAERNRLALEARYSTWQGAPFDGGDYAVSVHRADATTVDG